MSFKQCVVEFLFSLFVCLVKLFLAGRACIELMILPIFGIFWPPADRICVPSKDSTVARNALSGRGDLWL